MVIVQLFLCYVIIFTIIFGISFLEPDEDFKDRVISAAKVSFGIFLMIGTIVLCIFLLSLTC